MTEKKKVWFITGAGCGMGVEFAKSALAAGYQVVATGRDTAKLAKALISIARQEEPPVRLIAGSDAIAGAEQKVAELQQQINANRDLSTSLAYEDA
jgi:NAD(P)-dependent dehydrogenase (short-subunit alcohol dehydrogenase family)